MGPRRKLPTNWSLHVIFFYQVGVVLILLVTAFNLTAPDGTLPRYSWDHVLPLWVPWAGALGGCTISLVGVAEHSADWNGARFGYWHLMRPVLGMITGTVGVLAILFVLKGIAPDVIPATNQEYSPGGVAVMFVIAFVVGYREETFREMVKRVVDVILGPGEKERTQRLTLLPEVLPLTRQPTGGTSPVTGTITLFNDTKDTFDVATTNLTITGTGFTAEWADNTPVQPATSRTINVTWVPGTPATSSDEVVTVTIGGYFLASKVQATA